MMKAREVHWNRDTGIATAEPFPGGEKYTITENCTGIDLTAGDDLHARVDAQFLHIEAMTEQPLLIRPKKDSDELEVLTARQPDVHVDEGHSSKH